MVQDELDNRTYTEYVIKVKFNGQQWTINQKYKAFCSLHDSLLGQYPSTKFPDSSFQFSQRVFHESASSSGANERAQEFYQHLASTSTQADERTRNLELYLQELALIPTIKDSVQLKLFLGLNQKFPELCESYHTSLIPPEWISNNRSAQNQAPQPSTRAIMTQNIIGELFQHRKKQEALVPPDSSTRALKKMKSSPDRRKSNINLEDYNVEFDPSSQKMVV